MGTVLASKIAADAAEAMFDPGYNRFDQDDWLKWINDGQAEAAILKPDINVETAVVELQAGPKQVLEAGKTTFIRLTRNMGADGQTPGKAIFPVDMDHFSQLNPDWPTHSTSAEVQLYMFDDKNPMVFWVYPPQPDTGRGQVERVVGAKPPAIAKIDDPITIDDIYEHVLLHYVLYRAHAVNAKHSASEKADANREWNMFVTALGRRDLTEKAYAPKPKRGTADAG